MEIGERKVLGERRNKETVQQKRGRIAHYKTNHKDQCAKYRERFPDKRDEVTT